MTNPTPHGQVPEVLIDLIDAYAETRHRCGGIYNAKTEAARKAVIEALSGVQALSAAPAGSKAAPQQEARPCHVFTVRKAGGLTEWEPTTMALALPDGAHALYTLPQPSPHAQADSVTAPAQQGKWAWVPVEPSTAMLVAGNHGQPGDFSALKVWQDMIAALDRSADYTRPIDPPFVTIEPVGTPLGMYEHKCQNVTGHRGPSFVCQKAGQAVSQNSYCNNCHEATPQQGAQEPVAIVVECGNLYAKVKLSGKAFGTTKVGDELYRAPTAPMPLSDAAKDAARYRWLIDQHWIQTEVDWRLISTDQDSTIKQLDAAIDTAIAAQGGKA